MSSKTTQTQKATPFAPTIAPLTQGINQAQDLFNAGGFQVTPYQGDWVADADPLTTQGQDGLIAGAQMQADRLNPVVDSIGNIANTTQNFDFSQQRQNVIDAIMPSINASFAGSGMTGSTLHQANLAKGLAAGLGDAEAGFRAQELAAQGQQMQAAGMMPGLLQSQLAPYTTMMDVGGQRQAQNQAEIDATIQTDMLNQSAEATALRDYLALMSGVGGQFGTNTGTQSQRPGLLAIGGAALQGASLMSDRRLKTDIERVGQTDGGTPIYRYRYKVGGPFHFGVMAQDVPEAAVMTDSGYLAVRYEDVR